jgi:hypothetical protein
VREGCWRSASRFSYTRSRVALRPRPHRFSGGLDFGARASRRADIQAYSTGRLRPKSAARVDRARIGFISLEEAQRSGELVCQRP